MSLQLTKKEEARFKQNPYKSQWYSRSYVLDQDFEKRDYVSFKGVNGAELDDPDLKSPRAYRFERKEKLKLSQIAVKHAIEEGYSTVEEWKKNWLSIPGYAGTNRVEDPDTIVTRYLFKPMRAQ